MAWLAVDKNGDECIYDSRPVRYKYDGFPCWDCDSYCIYLPKGSIKKLIGEKLTWDDEPVEI